MPTTPVSPTLVKIATVRFTEGEYARLQLAATNRGLSVSELIRRAVFKREFPPPLPALMDMEGISQLRRLGVNLNQGVRTMAQWQRASEGDKKATWVALRATFAELAKTVEALATQITERRP